MHAAEVATLVYPGTLGKRHTPVDTTKYIYDKGEPVKVDPKAAAAHERNKNPRVKARDPESD